MMSTTRPAQQTFRCITLIVVAGLAARLLTLLITDPVPVTLSGDTPIFLAQRGFGYEPPGYPIFLDLTYPWLGAVGVVLLQMLATMFAAIMTCVRIPGKRGFWTALLIAVCPFFVIYELRLLTEALVCALLWLALLLLAWSKYKWEPLLAGVLIGVSILTRDTLYLTPLLLPLAAFRTPQFKPACVAAAVAFAMVLPWQVANRSLALSEGRAGLTLWIGTWETSPHWYQRGLDRPEWPANAFPSAERKARVLEAIQSRDDRTLAEIAIDRIASEPLQTAAIWALRYPRLWLGTRTDAVPLRLERKSIGWTVLKFGFFTLNLLVFAVALIGLWRSRNDPVTRLLAVPIVYLGFVLIPFHNTETRYSLIAFMPLLFFAAHAIIAFKDRPRAGKARVPLVRLERTLR